MFRTLSSIFILLLAKTLSAQIVGKVVDETGEPLPFATIYIQNSTKGTTANAAGEFRLAASPGEYRVVFQYIGYKQRIETVVVAAGAEKRLTVRLEPTDLQIGEIVVRANAEDPAYAIMREVIARRRFFKNRLSIYACDAYIKGMYKLLDAPKKIFGRDVGDMGGVLDTNRTGIIYLSESVSQLFVQAEPPRKKEVMISSKISGDPNGFSLNRATLTDFNLYDEHIEIEREILSPLADNAFSYYRFRLAGRFRDENGFDIAKVEVVPKRSEDPVFSGYLYIVDQQWNLQSVDLTLTGSAIHQPVLDSLQISQQFVPVDGRDGWALLSQVISFKAGVLGFNFKGFFNSVFSNYNLKPDFSGGFFDREIFKIEQSATERDSIYWEKIRPIPLTPVESRDYVRKDSLRQIWESKEYLDSVDRKDNRFKPIDILTGYTYQNSFRHFQISIPASLSWVQFNTVQGLVLNAEPLMRKEADKRGTRFWEVGLNLNYGFSEGKFRPSALFRRRFNSINYRVIEVSGGSKTTQFAESQPIGPFLNTSASLFGMRNYMKIYESTFARVEYGQHFSPVTWAMFWAEFSDRKLLENHSDFTWYKGDDRAYTSNFPIQLEGNEGILQGGRALMLGATFHFRFGVRYSTYPNFRILEGSKWPNLFVRYRKAIPNVANSRADFDFASVSLRQTNQSWGLFGHTDWHLSAGGFLRQRNLLFLDYFHVLGNQLYVTNPKRYLDGFFRAPYYSLSTKEPFFKAHVQHYFQGFVLDKIPLVRKLNWKEVLGFNVFYTREIAEPSEPAQSLPYWEVNFGIENIGWKAFRLFRVDVASSFYKDKYDGTCVVLGIGF